MRVLHGGWLWLEEKRYVDAMKQSADPSFDLEAVPAPRRPLPCWLGPRFTDAMNTMGYQPSLAYNVALCLAPVLVQAGPRLQPEY